MGGDSMLLEVMDNGQLAVASGFLERLHLKPGDKLEIFEEQGRFYMENPSMAAYRRVAKAFEGEAEKAGFHNEEELMAYLKEVRKNTH